MERNLHIEQTLTEESQKIKRGIISGLMKNFSQILIFLLTYKNLTLHKGANLYESIDLSLLILDQKMSKICNLYIFITSHASVPLRVNVSIVCFLASKWLEANIGAPVGREASLRNLESLTSITITVREADLHTINDLLIIKACGRL